MKNLTYSQELWIEKISNERNMTKDKANQFIVDICKNIDSSFISYEDIEKKLLDGTLVNWEQNEKNKRIKFI